MLVRIKDADGVLPHYFVSGMTERNAAAREKETRLTARLAAVKSRVSRRGSEPYDSRGTVPVLPSVRNFTPYTTPKNARGCAKKTFMIGGGNVLLGKSIKMIAITSFSKNKKPVQI